MGPFQSGLRQWQGSTFHQLIQFGPSPTLGPRVGICQSFSPETIKTMMDITEASADVALEKGAPIHADYSLGTIVTGGPYSITVHRVKDAIGSIHTHPFGNTYPSGHDVVEMMAEDDKILCIGRGGYIKTRVKCFTPTGDTDWEKIATDVEVMRQKFNAFNEEMAIAHPELAGGPLRQHLRFHDTPNWYRMIDLEGERRKLRVKADKLTPLERPWVPVCSWERDTEIEIRGGIPETLEEE